MKNKSKNKKNKAKKEWETVIDFTKIKKGGVSDKDVQKALEELKDFD